MKKHREGATQIAFKTGNDFLTIYKATKVSRKESCYIFVAFFLRHLHGDIPIKNNNFI